MQYSTVHKRGQDSDSGIVGGVARDREGARVCQWEGEMDENGRQRMNEGDEIGGGRLRWNLFERRDYNKHYLIKLN